MTPYTAPGISSLTEKAIIQIITEAFGLKSNYWMDVKLGKQKEVIPRQVLHACLIEYMGYSQYMAAAVTLQDHCTALHSYNRVKETLLRCKDVGPIIKDVFYQCERLNNAVTIAKKPGKML